MQDKNSIWWKLVNLEPTMLRGLIVGLVGLLGSIGILVSPNLPDTLLGFLVPLAAVIQLLWTRPAVTANARVAVYMPDPVNRPDIVESGEGVTTASDADIIDSATSGTPSS